ncbi:MAG: UvrD-helicase domain-containing protein [Flavobacteriaceae bacterium]|nr:UvrD-helicase domain-containing protein [Flavobacteriaceae bacterium]
MSHSNSFTIYNASAGSGKTFALVKAYLKKVITHSHNGYYKHLLAITFTNKAVAEMKIRIIKTLVGFSAEMIPSSDQEMLRLMVKETGLTEEKIRHRAKGILKHLLHHYAHFSVETIDHFNHRLIRTFARDLHLPLHFEVSLDMAQLISQAVDQLIDKAGEEKEITDILLEFALQKTDNDKSWDIAIDLKKAAMMLANENDAKHLNGLKGKSLSDFLLLRKKLIEASSNLETLIKTEANEVITHLEANDIPHNVFSRETLPNHFLKLMEGNNNVYINKLQEYLKTGGNALYKKNTPPDISTSIDSITPYLLEMYLQIKSRVSQVQLIQNILKNLIPLATVNLVNQELQKIKEEENILPINEFNALIYEQIKDQPAPFIYERLGERYRDFFIDEFQDTSQLQWNNLIPLIDNAISQSYEGEEPGSLLIVGDAKQAIYRWRGGKPEQFIDLYDGANPFYVLEDKTVENLDTNYRSHREIIQFNNAFFSFVSRYFGNETHQNLYTVGNQQKQNSKVGGYVHIEFVSTEKNSTLDKKIIEDPFSIKVLHAVKECLGLGYNKNDICVLTRKKKEGIQISEFLLENKIPVISEETLLLKNAAVIQCLIQVLQLSITPQNEEVKIQFLTFLHDHLSLSDKGLSQHEFFQNHIHESLEVLSETLKTYSIDFSFIAMQHLSLFESLEYSIEHLELDKKADSFLTSFMDLVFSFSQRSMAGKNSFLAHWESEMDRASISENKSTDAVKVMTIHKSKGLEFPVVIFPYAHLDIYREEKPTAWYPWNENGFDELLINFNKSVADYGEIGVKMFAQRRDQLELDNLNLLYVVLTRAVTQLYVFAKQEKPKDSPTTYSGFFTAFLQDQNRWEDSITSYTFGTPTTKDPDIKKDTTHSLEVPYIVSSPSSHNIKVVTSEVNHGEKENATAIGNLLHDTMALIETSENIDVVLSDLKIQLANEPSLFSEIKNMVTRIVAHPGLNHLFQPSEKIYNERDIITPECILRPDRINLHQNNTVTIVDYKTGVEKEVYQFQINSYAMALQDMGFTVKEKLLVYCNHDAILINKT